MRKMLVLLCAAFVLTACTTKENASFPFQVDSIATAKAPWKVGDQVVIYSNCPTIIANSDICYAVFLGITAKGNALLQDHYDTGEKLSDPYEYPFDIDLIQNPDSAKFNSFHHEGLLTRYYQNGQKMVQSTYTNGQRNGFTRLWYENGQLSNEEEVHNDLIQGRAISWYRNGQKWAQYTYVNGKWHGPYTVWYENGQIKEEGNYQDTFVPVGLWRYWDKNGNLIKEINYDPPK